MSRPGARRTANFLQERVREAGEPAHRRRETAAPFRERGEFEASATGGDGGRILAGSFREAGRNLAGRFGDDSRTIRGRF